MSRSMPKYRGPKNGQAFIRTKRLEGGREIYLGKFNSPQSKRRYAEWMRRLIDPQQEVPLPKPSGGSLTIVELILLFTNEVEARYTDASGRVRKEYKNVRDALRNLDEAFGDMIANEFEPSHLEELQRHLVDKGLSRGVLNKRITIIRRFFAWCSRNSPRTGIRKTLYWELASVKGLQRGEYGVRDRPKVRPVPLAIVEKTLPWLSPMVAAMVRVQLICGTRPDEVCRLKASELERHGDYWVFRPDAHKNAWRGAERMIVVPKLAQEILLPFLGGDPHEYIFTPAKSERMRQELRAREAGKKRKTKIYPCELRRRAQAKADRAANPARRFQECYTAESYWRAIQHGLNAAKAAGAEIPSWHPNRLRHTISTKVSQAVGQQKAKRWLGHANLATTDIYTELELQELLSVAKSLEQHWEGTIFARTPGILKPELNCRMKPLQPAASSPEASTLSPGSIMMSK